MKPRRPSLGERVAAVQRLQAGRVSIPEVAAHYGVSASQVDAWIVAHAGERNVSLEELRGEVGGEPGRLLRHAQRLRQLIALTDRTLHILHARLIKSIP
jgi:transposase